MDPVDPDPEHWDPHCFDADPDQDPAQNLDADPDPDPGGGEGQPKMCIPPGKILGTPLAERICEQIPLEDRMVEEQHLQNENNSNTKRGSQCVLNA